MRRPIRLATVGIALLTLLPLVVPAALAAGSDQVRIIAVFQDDVQNPGAAARDMGRRHNGHVTSTYDTVLRGFAGEFPASSLRGIERDPRIEYVDIDPVVHASAQTSPTGVRRVFADSNSNLTINDVDDARIDADIAVIDSGIDLDHPDLNVAGHVDCTSGICVGGGTAGDDDNGHGTHVAGTAAALDNGFGVVGVAPGARVHAVKVLSSSGSGQFSWVIEGIEWATTNGVDVANMSLGCLDCGTLRSVHDAISASVSAGVTHVVAAGNEDVDASRSTPGNDPNVITVSALADFDGAPDGNGGCRTFTGGGPPRSECDDTLAYFSNWGDDVEMAAPGWSIYSTVPGGYGTKSGTSMAAPHVAGAAALLASMGSSVSQITSTLLAEGNSNWNDDSGDGTTEPLLDLGDASVFDPTTVSTTGDQAPSVTLSSPGEGATVSGQMVALSAVASDDDGVAGVEFTVSGTSTAIPGTYSESDGVWTASWDSTAVVDGSYVVTATARDTTNQSVSDSHNVTVNNGSSPLDVTGVDPGSVNVGSTDVTVSGRGFAQDASVVLENGKGHTPTVTVTSVTAEEIVISVAVEAKGPTSHWDVRVTNPGGATDALVGGLQVNR